MEGEAGPPLRSGDQLAERMAELQRLVQAGLLSADDIADSLRPILKRLCAILQLYGPV